MRELIKALKALSDSTRLRILKLLMERECCVCEVMQALDISQTRASRNLGILHDAGFLQVRRDGLWALYSLDPSIDRKYIGQLITTIDQALKDERVMATDKKRLKMAVRVGPRCISRVNT